MMARVRELLNDIGGQNSTAGTGAAYTLTSSSSFTALTNGLVIGFKAHANGSASATINVNGLGARSIRRLSTTGDSAIGATDIVANGIYVATYNSSANSNAGGWVLWASSGLIANEQLVGIYTGLTGLTVTTNSNSAIIVSGANPAIKLNDTDSSAHDFWVRANNNIFAVSTDRTNSGVWSAPHPLQLYNANTTASVYGNVVWTAANDGAASGLDADLLDGQQGAYYLPAASYTAADVLTKIKTVDGSGSGLDADFLDGQTGSYYSDATNIAAGTLADARLPTRLGIVAKTITDWNSATENGWYNGNAATNAPSSTIVGTTAWVQGRTEMFGTGYGIQTAWGVSATPAAANTITAMRVISNSVWGSWFKVQLSQVEQDARYLALTGGTVSGSTNFTAGLQINSLPTSANMLQALKVEAITTSSVQITAGGGLSVTAAFATAGANGLDTGAKANSTWYFVWLIYNGTTPGALLSLSATAPTMPSGYTQKLRVGAVRVDASGNLWHSLQYGRRVQIITGTAPTVPPAMITGSSGNVSTPTWTAVSTAAFVPTTASVIWGTLNFNQSDNSGAIVAPNNSYGGWTNNTNVFPLGGMNSGITGSAINTRGQFSLVLESVNIYYASNNSGCGVFLNGWEDNL